MIKRLNDQISAQQALVTQTASHILDLDRQIRLATADLTFLKAHMSQRDQLLNQRLRYVDNHGAINYVQLVLTASNFNDLVNRMIGAQQVVDSDRRLLDDLAQERSLVSSSEHCAGHTAEPGRRAAQTAEGDDGRHAEESGDPQLRARLPRRAGGSAG